MNSQKVSNVLLKVGAILLIGSIATYLLGSAIEQYLRGTLSEAGAPVPVAAFLTAGLVFLGVICLSISLILVAKQKKTTTRAPRRPVLPREPAER